jgi:hypothetical protein
MTGCAVVGRVAGYTLVASQGAGLFGVTFQAPVSVKHDPFVRGRPSVRIVTGNTSERSAAPFVAAALAHLFDVPDRAKGRDRVAAPARHNHEITQWEARSIVEFGPAERTCAGKALQMALLANGLAKRWRVQVGRIDDCQVLPID